MRKPIPSIGNQDFQSIRENQYFYIDKTKFIKEWWENGDVATLITRPRRFGKTLNLSMLKCFFSNQYSGKNDLFLDLSIWKEEKYHKLQGSYPVIFLSFANVKADSFKDAKDGLIKAIADAYEAHSYLKNSDFLSREEKACYDALHLYSIDISFNKMISDSAVVSALNTLSLYLSRHYSKKVIIFLDEYDAPLQEAYVYGYWNEMISFMRSLFNSTFKTNPYLYRTLMTGITRVSKESVFSDLNNLVVITTTSQQYADCFGFTEKEVFQALEQQGLSNRKKEVKEWYDGFIFGTCTDIYNPWSITNFLKENKLKTYWTNTSSNNLINNLIQEGTSEMKIAMEDLLNGKMIKTDIEEEIVFHQLSESDSAVWSLLLASGYLKAEQVPEDGKDISYQLSLTNFEVQKMFQKMIQGWFKNKSVHYGDFIKAFLADDIDYMNQYMNQVALQTFSFFDVGKQLSERTEPERFYHGFVLGLMVDLADRYRIMSNRESGFGRYDIVMEPLEKAFDAIVIEFKVFHSKKENDLQDTIRAALRQIEKNKYDTELLMKGITEEKIRHYGFAFRGKEVLIGK